MSKLRKAGITYISGRWEYREEGNCHEWLAEQKRKGTMKLHILAARVLFVSAYVVFGIVIFVAAATILLKAVITARARAKIEPAKVFAGYVLDPIPESVTNIKADQPMKFRGVRYTLRFNISREDLGLIIESRPFQRVWNVEYGDGNLSWYWEEQNVLGMRVPKYIESLLCYDYTREPRWFRPGQWDNPEAYAFWKEGDLVNTQLFDSDKNSSGPVNIQVLLYNEKEGQAYFIVTRFNQ